MAMSKVNFTIPEELIALLNNRIAHRKRSAFVAAAIQESLLRMNDEALDRELSEGYRARAGEGARINAEWEAATLEISPDE
jgi:metal-responsive CopG/Arc/MetJ family transcriptional regulator